MSHQAVHARSVSSGRHVCTMMQHTYDYVHVSMYVCMHAVELSSHSHLFALTALKHFILEFDVASHSFRAKLILTNHPYTANAPKVTRTAANTATRCVACSMA